MNFLFRLPRLKGELSQKTQDVIMMATLCERLAEENRTRVAHPSGRPENVAEHSFMLVKVAVHLAQKYYPTLDTGQVALYASVHDDVEAYVGDTPTGEWCNTDYVSKQQVEAEGLAQLERDFTPFAPGYVELVKEYEAQDKPEARFVRMVDKVIATTIQVTDEGKEANKHFTKQNFISNEQHGYDKHIVAYPEWKEILDLKTEIARYVSEYLLEK